MKATIFEICELNGKKSYIDQVSSDDRLLLSIYAQKTLFNHVKGLAEELEWDNNWEIHYQDRFGKNIPECVNAIAVGYKTERSSTRTATSLFQYCFQIEYPKGK